LVRILGGESRGRKLLGPKGLRFRPTTGRVKESIFNYLNQKVEGSRFLDLFSGTGALGLEALSRGAKEIYFIEKSSYSINLLSRNIDLCGYKAKTRIFKGDVFEVVKKLGRVNEIFDIILADPPFKEGFHSKILSTVSQSEVLLPKGLLVIEHESHDKDDGHHQLEPIKQKQFGASVVSIYQKLGDA